MAFADFVREIKGVLVDDFNEVPDGLGDTLGNYGLEHLAHFLGRQIPPQLEELLRVHDGESQSASCRLLESGWLLPAAIIEEDYKTRVGSAAREGLLDVTGYLGIEAVGPVHRSLWRSGWIPFMEVGKDAWVVDLDPCDGTVGQVVSVQMENGVVTVEASSIEDLLSRYLRSLRRGVREFLAAF